MTLAAVPSFGDARLTNRIKGDFNGLFGDLLCISHSATAVSETGEQFILAPGQELIAFEDDVEDGQPMYLVARGSVVESPPELQCLGSTWCLKINADGVRHVHDLDDA